MSREEFQIFYRGDDVADGTMNVRELAPSLLALGEAFEEINRQVNKKESSIKINVKAVHAGSFGVSLEVLTDLPSQISALVGTLTVEDAKSIFSMLFGSAGVIGLIELIRRARSRKPTKATVISSGEVQLEFSGNDNTVENITVNKNTYNTFINIPIRKSIEQFVVPLERKGIDEIGAIKNTEQIENILKKEVRYFKAPAVEEKMLQEYETTMVLSIVMLSFKGDSWRMSDGQSAFWVTIKDTAFLNQVDANRASFTKGDKLRFRVRVTQFQTPENELKTSYEALEVIDHIQGSLQLKLELVEESPKKKPDNKEKKKKRKDNKQK